MNDPKSIFGLKNKHAAKPDRTVSPEKARALLDGQSLKRASLGAILAAFLMIAIWVYFSMFMDRFYPWGSIIQGFFIGRAVRHFGRGLQWQFPLLAATASVLAALTGSFIASLNLTAREFGVTALSLVSEISWHTIKTFVVDNFGVVGLIYALTAAAIAAVIAKRRLSQYEEVALQKLDTTESL